MANAFYAMNKGQTEMQVTEAASTQSKDIEVNIDQTKFSRKEDVLLSLEQIANYILTDHEKIWG